MVWLDVSVLYHHWFNEGLRWQSSGDPFKSSFIWNIYSFQKKVLQNILNVYSNDDVDKLSYLDLPTNFDSEFTFCLKWFDTFGSIIIQW